MSDKKLNLSAYYYTFDPTGNAEVDSILEAVAQAGNNFHNTDQWDQSYEWLNDGLSAAENIQLVANKAAESLATING